MVNYFLRMLKGKGTRTSPPDHLQHSAVAVVVVEKCTLHALLDVKLCYFLLSSAGAVSPKNDGIVSIGVLALSSVRVSREAHSIAL